LAVYIKFDPSVFWTLQIQTLQIQGTARGEGSTPYAVRPYAAAFS
jgi:hypothetical protein